MDTLLRLTVANMKGLVRDRAALFWTFFFPILFVLLFGVLFSGSGDSKVSVGFVNEDNTPVSVQIQQQFEAIPILTIQTGSLADEKAAMQRGDVSAVIVAAKTPVALQVYTDPSKSQTSQAVTQVVQGIANGFNLGLAGGSAVLGISQ